MTLEYVSTVPLRPNCRVSYMFPTEFYDASKITSIRTGDLLGSEYNTYTPGVASYSQFEVKDELNGFKSITFLACKTFRPNDPREKTLIVGLDMPDSTEGGESLKIFIRDQDGATTAKLEKGLTHSPFAGRLTIEEAAISPTTV